jgi:hypothetical protein
MASKDEHKALQVGERVEVDLSAADPMRTGLHGTALATITSIVPGYNDYGIWVEAEGVDPKLRFSAASSDDGQTFWCPSIRKQQS